MAGLIEIAVARQAVLERAARLPAETIPLANALGRVSDALIESPLDQPSYTKSLVDGFALSSEDLDSDGRLEGQIATSLNIFAGDEIGSELTRGTVAKIMTGAPLPLGADTVVMREDVVEHENAIELLPKTTIRAGQHVLTQGAAIRKGATLLPSLKRMRPVELGVLADANQATIDVVRRPIVGLIQTGDELLPLGSKLTPGKIINSNGVMLSALVDQSGSTVRDFGAAPDTRSGLGAVVEQALNGVDVLLLSGGVSKGDRDYVPEVLSAHGVEPVFHRVDLRPGKPLWFGVTSRPEGERSRTSTLVFGLPGNPVSSFVCFQLFVLPALRVLGGLQQPSSQPADLTNDMRAITQRFELRGSRPAFWPGVTDSDGGVQALPWLGSADPFRLVHADCLIYFSIGNKSYEVGERVGIVMID